MWAYDTGSVLATDAQIMDWYLSQKDRQSITYFEGGQFSLYFARRDSRQDVMPVVGVLDTLADDGRIVLVHQRLTNGNCRYIAQRVPVSRMSVNQRSKRWKFNLPASKEIAA